MIPAVINTWGRGYVVLLVIYFSYNYYDDDKSGCQ